LDECLRSGQGETAPIYAFVHIDKTGGTTVKSVLRRSFGTRHCDVRLPMGKRSIDGIDHRAAIDALDLARVERVYRNLRGFAGHNVKAYTGLARQFPELRFFTFLRDPVSRFRSHFLNRSEEFQRADFERWCAAPWYCNWQTKMLVGEPNAEKAIELLATRVGFVGLTERFDESLLMLGPWLAEPGWRPEYRRLNQFATKGDGQGAIRKAVAIEYLKTDAVRAQMRQLNAEDQKVYDYVTAHVFPRQIAAHAGDLAAELRAFQERQKSSEALAESAWSRLVRNYIYKPLSHVRVA
jgi:Sulfotransferase family